MIFNIADNDGAKKLELSLFGLANGKKQSIKIFEDLAEAYGKGNVEAEDLEKKIKGLSKADKEYARGIANSTKETTEKSAAFSSQAQILKRSTGALKAFGKSLGNVALNMGIMLLATLAIRGAITVFDELFTTTKEHKEQLAELGSEYEALKSSIESLNGELETTQASHYYNTLE